MSGKIIKNRYTVSFAIDVLIAGANLTIGIININNGNNSNAALWFFLAAVWLVFAALDKSREGKLIATLEAQPPKTDSPDIPEGEIGEDVEDEVKEPSQKDKAEESPQEEKPKI